MKFLALLLSILTCSICNAQTNDLTLISGTVKKIVSKELGYWAYIEVNDSRIEMILVEQPNLKYPQSYIVFNEGEKVSILAERPEVTSESYMIAKSFAFIQSEQAMKKILSSSINKDSVKLESIVEFTTSKDDKNKLIPSIAFKLQITNLSNAFIPALSPINNLRLINEKTVESVTDIYINGKKSGLGIYNGLGFKNETLNKGNSDETGVGWSLSDADLFTDGNIITVQWKYMGILSDIVKVDLKNQKLIK